MEDIRFADGGLLAFFDPGTLEVNAALQQTSFIFSGSHSTKY